MKTLESKQIIPYADKGCNYSSREGVVIPFDCEDLADIFNYIKDYDNDTWQEMYKLHLYPLSWLTKPIEHNGEKFVPIQRIFDRGLNFIKAFESRKTYCMAEGNEKEPIITEIPKDVTCIPYWQVQKLIGWHFWIFDQSFFEKGIIIDKSTL